jgi:hypothetical protein
MQRPFNKTVLDLFEKLCVWSRVKNQEMRSHCTCVGMCHVGLLCRPSLRALAFPKVNGDSP